MTQYVFLIGPDETINRGELAYLTALSAPLQKRDDLNIYTFKRLSEKTTNNHPLFHGAISGADAYITSVPFYSDVLIAPILESITADDQVILLGGGHSTLRTIALLKKHILKKTTHVQAGWATHMVEQQTEVDIAHDAGITLFTPAWTEEAIRTMPHGDKVAIVGLLGIPTGNDAQSLNADRDRFLQYNSVGQDFAKNGMTDDFIAVIANAGFKEETGTHFAVPLAESHAHGKRVGAAVPAGTTLLYVHGGPRNLQDEDHLQQTETATDTFVRGYRDAQSTLGGEPKIFIDHFPRPDHIPAMRTNSANAVIALSQDPHCLFAIMPDEGEGTKSDALMYGQSGKIRVLPSSLVERDPSGQRQASRAFYHAHGLTVWSDDQIKTASAAPFVFDMNQLPHLTCLRYFGLIG
jgi:hypothetical protein